MIKNKRLIFILITILFLLLIPLIAMQFTHEVKWTISDFLVMFILLLATGISCEFTWRKVLKFQNKIFVCLIILAAFFLLWVQLAVGIF